MYRMKYKNNCLYIGTPKKINKAKIKVNLLCVSFFSLYKPLNYLLRGSQVISHNTHRRCMIRYNKLHQSLKVSNPK